MDIRGLHAAHVASGVSASFALIAASGEVKPAITQAQTAEYINKHSDAISINWPKIIRELARSGNPASG